MMMNDFELDFEKKKPHIFVNVKILAIFHLKKATFAKKTALFCIILKSPLKSKKCQ